MQYSKTAAAAGLLMLLNTVPAAAETGAKAKIVNPDGLYDPAPYGYSHAVISTNAGSLAHIAGQGGENSSGELAADFEGQVAQAYANLSAALAAAGARPDQVVKINTYVVDYNQSMLSVMTKHVVKTFGDHLPAQTLVPVPRLAIDGMLFEVDAIAVLDD
jgi:enamine deaminase RidA (YjgF/YER057c/UK114 family)